MPYSNEHACRIRDPDGFQPKSFRRMERPKGVSLIIARPKGKTTTATQSIRYDKQVWTADRARADCKEKEGTFEAAAKESKRDEYQEASWQDIVSLEEGTMDMKEAVFSFNDRRDMLGSAIQAKFGKASDKYSHWIRDMWEEDLVYEDANTRKFYKVSYTIDSNGKVTFGEPKQVLVQTTYEELSEAITIKAQIQGFLKQADTLLGAKDLPDAVRAHIKDMRTALHKSWDDLMKGDEETEEAIEQVEIGGDIMTLVEAIAKEADTVRIKIIQPGWGASGYYSLEVLERDATVYKKGTQMFWNHQTEAEEKARPEGSLYNLAGVLASDAEWDSGGPAGPGIYAKAQIFGGYKDVISEMAPHIGVSHRAFGKAKKGEAEGQKGDIIEQITAAKSVDFVTVPGAGGKVLQLFEAAKGRGVSNETNIRKEEDMTDEEKAALEGKLQAAETERDSLRAENETLKTENARLSEKMLLIEATALVVAELKEAQIPDLTRQRLIETLRKNPPVKDGKLDEETFKVTIKEQLTKEVEYLSKVTGSGQIRGMGGSQATGTLKESFKAQYLRENKTEEEAERLATIAAEGR